MVSDLVSESRSLPAVTGPTGPRPVYDAGERVVAEVVEDFSIIPSEKELAILERIATTAAKSAFIAGARTPERALMLILAGREFGMGPWQALSGMHVIQERPTLSATAMAALIQRYLRKHRGGIFRITESTNERCTVEYRRPEWDTSSFVTWTIEDARRAGLLNKDNWLHHPRQMLASRAIGEAARGGFPDVILNLYTPEELEFAAGAEAWSTSSASAPPAADQAPSATAPSTTAPADEAATRQKAISALHALVGERYPDRDPHTAVKLLQAHVCDEENAHTSLADPEAWSLDGLRRFYRQLRQMAPADMDAIVTSEDPPSPDALEELVYDADGRLINAATGEVVEEQASAPISERERALIELRELAETARNELDWATIVGEIKEDLGAWDVVIGATSNRTQIKYLRAATGRLGIATPQIEQRLIARDKELAGKASAATR